jgi:hypothetical protein
MACSNFQPWKSLFLHFSRLLSTPALLALFPVCCWSLLRKAALSCPDLLDDSHEALSAVHLSNFLPMADDASPSSPWLEPPAGSEDPDTSRDGMRGLP